MTRIGELEPDVGDPSGTGLDGAGRRTGIDAVARAGTGPGGFVLDRCDRLSQDVEIRRRSGFDMPVDGSSAAW